MTLSNQVQYNLIFTAGLDTYLVLRYVSLRYYLSPQLVHGNLLRIEEQGAGIDAFTPLATLGKLCAVGTPALCPRSKHVSSSKP